MAGEQTNTTKKIIGVYNEVRQTAPKRFLSSFFRRPTSEREIGGYAIEIHAKKASRLRARDVPLGARGKYVTGAKHTIYEYVPPYYDEGDVENAKRIYTRSFGKDPYDISNAASVLDDLLEGWMEATQRIERQEEYQASKAIFDGSYEIEARNEIIEFERNADNMVNLTLANFNAKPLETIGNVASAIKKNGKRAPQIAIFGLDAWRALSKNEEFSKRLDQRHRMENTILFQRQMNTGAIYRGMLVAGQYELEIYTYEEHYQDEEEGPILDYVPLNKITILPSSPDWQQGYGGVPAWQNVSAGMMGMLGVTKIPAEVSAFYHPEIFTDDKAVSIEARVKSRNMMIMKQPDQCGTITITQ